MYNIVNISELKGKLLTNVRGAEVGSESIIFTCFDGTEYEMYPYDDMGGVAVEDIIGDISSIIGTRIIDAREETNKGDGDANGFTQVWTFYIISTVKGDVTIRWFGGNNGHYSDEVIFSRIK